jgi:hypothetical protein
MRHHLKTRSSSSTCICSTAVKQELVPTARSCNVCCVRRWRADELLDRHQQAVNQVRDGEKSNHNDDGLVTKPCIGYQSNGFVAHVPTLAGVEYSYSSVTHKCDSQGNWAAHSHRTWYCLKLSMPQHNTSDWCGLETTSLASSYPSSSGARAAAGPINVQVRRCPDGRYTKAVPNLIYDGAGRSTRS